MHLYVDVSWLLDVQEAALGAEDMSVADYSALVAAVARHKTKLPTLEAADRRKVPTMWDDQLPGMA